LIILTSTRLEWHAGQPQPAARRLVISKSRKDYTEILCTPLQFRADDGHDGKEAPMIPVMLMSHKKFALLRS
jgi:hypothetical protein